MNLKERSHRRVMLMMRRDREKKKKEQVDKPILFLGNRINKKKRT